MGSKRTKSALQPAIARIYPPIGARGSYALLKGVNFNNQCKVKVNGKVCITTHLWGLLLVHLPQNTTKGKKVIEVKNVALNKTSVKKTYELGEVNIAGMVDPDGLHPVGKAGR